jgi:hypothetical protein
MKSILSLFLFLMLILPFYLFSQIPRTLSYQGLLTDSLGNPKPDGVYTFTFRLYYVASSLGATVVVAKPATNFCAEVFSKRRRL